MRSRSPMHLAGVFSRAALLIIVLACWIMPVRAAGTLGARQAAGLCSVSDPACTIEVSGWLRQTLHQHTAFVNARPESSGEADEEASTTLDAVLTVNVDGLLSRYKPLAATYTARVTLHHSDLFHQKVVVTCKDKQQTTLHTWGSDVMETGQATYRGSLDVYIPASPRSQYYASGLLKAGVPVLKVTSRVVNEDAISCPDAGTPRPSPSPSTTSMPSLIGMGVRAHGSVPASSPALLSGTDSGVLAPLYSREKGVSTLTLAWHLTAAVSPLAPLTR